MKILLLCLALVLCGCSRNPAKSELSMFLELAKCEAIRSGDKDVANCLMYIQQAIIEKKTWQAQYILGIVASGEYVIENDPRRYRGYHIREKMRPTPRRVEELVIEWDQRKDAMVGFQK